MTNYLIDKGKIRYPIITEEMQEQFEKDCIEQQTSTYIPVICGIYGRACRQMDKKEGANRMLCSDCTLAGYVNEVERRGLLL